MKKGSLLLVDNLLISHVPAYAIVYSNHTT